jgi:hypothetical protein
LDSFPGELDGLACLQETGIGWVKSFGSVPWKQGGMADKSLENQASGAKARLKAWHFRRGQSRVPLQNHFGHQN